MNPPQDDRQAEDFVDVNTGEHADAETEGSRTKLVAHCQTHGYVTSCSANIHRVAGRAVIHNRARHADGSPGAGLYFCD